MQIGTTKFVSLHAATTKRNLTGLFRSEFDDQRTSGTCAIALRWNFAWPKSFPPLGSDTTRPCRVWKCYSYCMRFPKIFFFLCRFIVATQYIRTKPAGINQPNVSKFWHFRKYKCVQFGKMRFFFRPKSSYSSLSLFHSLLSQTGKKGHRPKMTHLASGTAHVFTLNWVFDARDNCMRRNGSDSCAYICLIRWSVV